jgi:hypothetical protein
MSKRITSIGRNRSNATSPPTDSRDARSPISSSPQSPRPPRSRSCTMRQISTTSQPSPDNQPSGSSSADRSIDQFGPRSPTPGVSDSGTPAVHDLLPSTPVGAGSDLSQQTVLNPTRQSWAGTDWAFVQAMWAHGPASRTWQQLPTPPSVGKWLSQVTPIACSRRTGGRGSKSPIVRRQCV